MQKEVGVDRIYVSSEDIVAREIEGELIIVPLVSGIADMEEELFTLNETGREIWRRLDGKRKLEDIVKELSTEYNIPPVQIAKDTVGLVEELVRRGILVEVRRS